MQESVQASASSGSSGYQLHLLSDNLRRVDLDNLEKAMLDGLQGILYENDSQIKQKSGEMRYNKEHPGVEVEIWQL